METSVETFLNRLQQRVTMSTLSAMNSTVLKLYKLVISLRLFIILKLHKNFGRCNDKQELTLPSLKRVFSIAYWTCILYGIHVTKTRRDVRIILSFSYSSTFTLALRWEMTSSQVLRLCNKTRTNSESVLGISVPMYPVYIIRIFNNVQMNLTKFYPVYFTMLAFHLAVTTLGSPNLDLIEIVLLIINKVKGMFLHLASTESWRLPAIF